MFFPKVFSHCGALYMCDKFILISDLQELAIGNLTDIKIKFQSSIH